ncbi:MAG: D-glycerate dehydrogenase [Planctomycetota bacterium]
MSPKQIYITRKIPEAGINRLKQAGLTISLNLKDKPVQRLELLRRIKDQDGLLCLLSDKIDQEIIDAGKRLKIISAYAVGYDNIDVPYATKKKIMVTNTPDVLTDATAELAWALIFACARRIVESDRFVRSGKFKTWGPTRLLGSDIHHKTLGIIGAGRIGQAVGFKAKGFNMKLLYNSRHRKTEFEKNTGARLVSLQKLLKESDFVTIHTPLTAQTRHLIGPAELRLMKPSAYLINTARGPVVDEPALVRALKNKFIAGTGLDVYEHEPAIHPGLLKLNNVVLLPHLGSATTETRNKMAGLAAENLIAGLGGKKPPNLVNPHYS